MELLFKFILVVSVAVSACIQGPSLYGSGLKQNELFRIQLYPGNDLVLHVDSNPCSELIQYCLLLNLTYTEGCVQRYQHKVQGELLVFSELMKHLLVDERLFSNCEEEIPVYNKEKLGDFYTELLQILQNAPSGDTNALQFFDSRRNEMRMNQHEAIDLYKRAIIMHPNSTYIVSQFGLVLMSYGYKHLADSLWQNAVERGLWPSILQRPEWSYIPQNDPKPWYDPQDFPFVAALEAGYATIRRELVHNLERREHLQSEDIANRAAVKDNQWKVIHLKFESEKDYADNNISKYFPETVKILESCNADFILAKFSAIVPGTHIKPHTGPSNDRLRVHLALVHTGGARLRVGREWQEWKEGKVVIFDSSWEHEVYHDGPDPRIILILDIRNFAMLL